MPVTCEGTGRRRPMAAGADDQRAWFGARLSPGDGRVFASWPELVEALGTADRAEVKRFPRRDAATAWAAAGTGRAGAKRRHDCCSGSEDDPGLDGADWQGAFSVSIDGRGGVGVGGVLVRADDGLAWRGYSFFTLTPATAGSPEAHAAVLVLEAVAVLASRCTVCLRGGSRDLIGALQAIRKGRQSPRSRMEEDLCDPAEEAAARLLDRLPSCSLTARSQHRPGAIEWEARVEAQRACLLRRAGAEVFVPPASRPEPIPAMLQHAAPPAPAPAAEALPHDVAAGWACAACTYVHAKPEEADYLLCSMCGHERTGEGKLASRALAASSSCSTRDANGSATGHAIQHAAVGRELLPFEERETLSQLRYEQDQARPQGTVADATRQAPEARGGATSAREETLDAPTAGGGERRPPESPPRVWRREELLEWLARPEQQHIALDESQRRVLEAACLHGRNCFYSGPGGVGKSFVTKVIISFFRAVYASEFSRAVAIAASTGIAATHIGGSTIHSATGVGVPQYHSDFERRMSGASGQAKAKHLAMHLHVLLIDEVSMLAAEFFDLLDEQMRQLVARYGRGVKNEGRGERPDQLPAFGGIQIIATGDFFQLPPITGRVPMQTWPRLSKKELQEHRAVLHHGLERSEVSELFLNRGFAFQSAAWWRADFYFAELTKVRSHGVTLLLFFCLSCYLCTADVVVDECVCLHAYVTCMACHSGVAPVRHGPRELPQPHPPRHFRPGRHPLAEHSLCRRAEWGGSDSRGRYSRLSSRHAAADAARADQRGRQ